MATKKDIEFSTYIERDLTKSVIDWNTISKTLTDDLTRIQKERTKNKAEIEKKTLEAETTINTLEQYDNADLGGLALGMSGESAKFLQTQNDLFKRGLINQTEFAQARQRVLADWKSFSNITKQWNDDYKSYVNRINDGSASNLEKWLNSQNVAFGNLENVQGYVNPQTGRLSLIEVDPETGVPSDDPGKHVSMNTINQRFKTQYNKIDPTQLVKGKVDELGALLIETLGSRQEVMGAKGWGTKKGDAKFQAQMRKQAQGLMSDDNVAVLASSASIGAQPTYDKNDIKEGSTDFVLMKIVGGRPVLDPDAENIKDIKQEVEDLLYGNMMIQLDTEFTVEKGFEKLSTDVDALVDEEIKDKISVRDLNERKLQIQRDLANNTIDKTEADIAIDKLNVRIKEKQTEANIKNIDSLIADRELSGEQRTTQMLINADLQNQGLELKREINKQAEEAKIVPYTYRDDGAVALYGDFEGTGSAYLEDKLGKNIKTSFTAADTVEALGAGAIPLLIGGPVGVAGALATAIGVRVGQYINKDELDEVTNTLSTYISGTMDPNYKAKLLEDGPFEVRFGLTNEGSLDPSKMIFELGGQEFDFPPAEDGPAKDAAMKIIRTSGISTAGIKQWMDEYIIDPMTTAGIANQIAEKENLETPEELSFTEFVVKFGNISNQQAEYNKYLEDPVNYIVPVEGDNIIIEE